MRLATLVGYRGVTYRQLDYWARRGWLGEGLAARPGSGTERNLSDQDVERVKAIADLVDAGLRIEVAVELAAAATSTRRVRLNDRWMLIRIDRPTDGLAGPIGPGVPSGP